MVNSSRCLFLAVVAWCTVPTLNAAESDNWKERLLKAAPLAWESVVSQSPVLMDSRIENPSGGEPDLQSTYKRNGDSVLVSSLYSTGKGEVYCVNEYYGFRIVQESSDAPWKIVDLAVRSRNEDLSGITRDTTRHRKYFSHLPVMVCVESLPKLLATEGFQIKSVEPVERSGRQLVQVDFECALPSSYRSSIWDLPYRVKSGTVILDPDMLWCVNSYSYELTGQPGVIVREQNVLSKNGDRPFVKSQRKTVSVKGVEKVTKLIAVSEIRFSAPPLEREFRLSAYGLPEPANVPNSRPWFLYAGLLGIACIVGAVLLRKLLRP